MERNLPNLRGQFRLGAGPFCFGARPSGTSLKERAPGKEVKVLRLLLLIITFIGQTALAGELTVSAAAGAMELIKEVGKEFSKEKGVKVYFNFSSSGRLAKQIEAGAPVDVFISASHFWSSYLEKKGLLKEVRPIAKTKLVAVAPKDSKIKSLLEAEKIAVGNKFAPVGKYAIEALKREGLYGKLKGRLIFSPTVRQITLWVASGNVDAGIIYYSDFLRYTDRLKLIKLFPPTSHSPIYFYGGCTQRGGELCKEFLNFLEASEEIYPLYGFEKVK